MASGAMSVRVRAWWRAMDGAPDPLSRAQRIAVSIASALVALSRFAAISLTPWDWDEAQFISALRSFDVTLHHPHPPGFPLFIAAAKLLTFAGVTAFRALQTIDVVAAMAIFPAMFFLARELRASFDVSFTSAAFLAFFPNVWFYGGTAFSDVPAMVLVIVAVALLMRGCRSNAAFIGGAVLLAVAAGFRPQNLVIGALPFVIGAMHRRRVAPVVGALTAIVLITGVGYAFAVQRSGGWAAYRETLAIHQDYITRVDSFRSPDRPALWRVFDDFFIRPYRAPMINTVITILVIAGAFLACSASNLAGAGRQDCRPYTNAGALVLLLAFAPFCLFAWLVLDRFSVSRFSIGYAPLMAFLAAEGLFAIPWRRAAAAVAATLIVLMIVWTIPALNIVRTTASPPAAAIDFIRRSGEVRLLVQDSMTAFAEAMLAGRTFDRPRGLPRLDFSGPGLSLDVTEGVVTGAPSARTFQRDRTRLWNLVRQRYFDVSVAVVPRPQFGDGWYAEEKNAAGRVWRWMGRCGAITLSRSDRPGRLDLEFFVPSKSQVTIAIGGRLLERLEADGITHRSFAVALDRDIELTLAIDRVVVPAQNGSSRDTRQLGLRLDFLQLEIEP